MSEALDALPKSVPPLLLPEDTPVDRSRRILLLLALHGVSGGELPIAAACMVQNKDPLMMPRAVNTCVIKPKTASNVSNSAIVNCQTNDQDKADLLDSAL